VTTRNYSEDSNLGFDPISDPSGKVFHPPISSDLLF
jgi:hypothetical protein